MRWLVVLCLASCYRPTPQAGARCAEGGLCPSGLTCRADICVDDDTPPDDARPDALVDAPHDGTTPDAISTIGCADGAREAFVDVVAFPAIAGCAASWTGTLDLRAPPTGQLCGDDVQLCAAPADACAAGWHLCGTNGQPSELTSRASEAACTTAGNANDDARYVAALAHCTSYDMGVCDYTVPRPCPPANSCGEPICCGIGCRNDAGCMAGAWPVTPLAGTLLEGCGAMRGTDVSGVMCCR